MSGPSHAVVITGCSGGIGQALCAAFQRHGAWVIGIDMQSVGQHVDAWLPADLQCLAAGDTRLIDGIVEAAGGRPIRTLVNNAACQLLGPAAGLSLTDWRRTMDVNLMAPVVLSSLLLTHLAAARGSIINIASIHANQTKPGFVAYATSKAALVGFTKSLAVDVGEQVRVNAILPAAIRTPMLEAGFADQPEQLRKLEQYHPSQSIGEPGDVAALAVFLSGEAGAFMNGAVIALDGGISSRLHDPV